MIDYSGTYTDYYQLNMAQIYFLAGKKDAPSTFDYFFRQPPFKGGFAVFAGLEDLLTVLETLKFTKQDLILLSQHGFCDSFLDYLKQFKFTGTVHACHEGEIVFPTIPIVRVTAPIIEAQLIETLLLNLLNFQTLIATKAARIRQAAENTLLADFGLRRAQGPGGYYASRAAIIGGFDATSNVKAGLDYGIPLSGTMAHALIQSYDSELAAFRDFAEKRPKDCVLLVDTYDTLKSGIPNAIKVAHELKSRGDQLKGIRLDSGDFAYLSIKARQMLDDAGLHSVSIIVSNQLDEYIIASLKAQKAPIDAFGVGTNLVIGRPDGAVDGVYKLADISNHPRIKISETMIKTTLPCKKQVYRLYQENDSFLGADLIARADEDPKEIDQIHHPVEPFKSLSIKSYKKEPLLHPVFNNGSRLTSPQPLAQIAKYVKQRLLLLGPEYMRLNHPHLYKVGLSESIKTTRDQLIKDRTHF